MFSQIAANIHESPKNAYLAPILINVIKKKKKHIFKNYFIKNKKQKALNNNNWKPNHNVYKSDVFTLGMNFV
jgi:hypothetical protein